MGRPLGGTAAGRAGPGDNRAVPGEGPLDSRAAGCIRLGTAGFVIEEECREPSGHSFIKWVFNGSSSLTGDVDKIY